jgi:predicted RNA-binding Zn-ribbon protein involved in translation (DUF1610 family)
MSFTTTYNQEEQNKKEVGVQESVFQPSFSDVKKEIDINDFVTKVENQVREILIKRFPNISTKQQISPKVGRLNISCPYCGDSATDHWKKRGNLYLASFDYHCFNCGYHTNYENMAKDFSKDIDVTEINFLRETSAKASVNRGVAGNLDPSIFMQSDVIEKWAVDRVELILKMGFSEAKGSSIETYLRKRLQFDMSRFAWNEKAQKLLIFNLTSDKKKVLGFQIRNFKALPKYLTFKLSRIYLEIFGMDIPEEEEFIYADKISTTFGIMDLDINKPITVFEGPLDAYLFNNAVAVCSVKNDFPFDINVRWMYDYDKAGKEAAIEKIKRGEQVFLWKKFLNNFQSEINISKKIDLTDLMVYTIRKKLQIPNFENYFSTSKYDVYWI